MQSARYRDTFREIKKTFGRYLSIMLIVALGCGFFSGIKATMPDMIDSASQYFIDNKLMDYRIMSSIGIRSEDVEAVRKAEGVKGAVPGYAKDVFYTYDETSCVLKVMSYNNTLKKDSRNYLNNTILLSGRFPEKSGECVVEKKASSPETFVIGNTLVLESAYEKESIYDTFKTDTYEIVGIITSPLYIGYERDATDVGGGEVLSYIMVPETDFTADYYTELFVSLEGLEDMDPFSDEYRDAVEEKKQPAFEAFSESVNKRYEGLVANAQRDIGVAEKNRDLLSTALSLKPDILLSQAKTYESQIASLDEQIEKAEKQGKNTLMLTAQRTQLQVQKKACEDIASGDEEIIGEYKAQLSSLEEMIASGNAQLEEIKAPVFYEFDRFTSSEDYASFYNDAQKIDKLSKVFPVFFIIVAALVCLTTMTRMVDDERTLIGTYKALGYSSWAVSFKFLFYGLSSSLIGSVVGTVIGLQVFPKIIYTCYKIMYNIPSIDTPFKPAYCLACVLVSLLCTGVTILWACLVSLKSQPAELMRPKAPPVGRRVMLERFPKVWNRLGFLSKVTVRNLLRYKKRFIMTIVGVAGCTALIMTGFGLKYSIGSMADKQFSEVWQYDGAIAFDTTKGLTSSECIEGINEYSEIKSYIPVRKYTGSVTGQERVSQPADVVIPSEADRLDEYITMTEDGKELALGDDSVIITEKLAQLLDVSTGDSINVDIQGLGKQKVKIGGVMKNYTLHYVYISPSLFEGTFDEAVDYNMAFFSVNDGTDLQKLKTTLIADERFLGVSLKLESAKGFVSSLESLDAVVIMLIVCAGFLASVVLYNLANINITERSRELATLKVLGFYDIETSEYIYRENVAGTVIGILVGFLLGIVLHYFVVITSEVDIVMFNRELVWYAYVFSALITAAFAVVINLFMHLKIKGINEVESLKSIE